MGRTLQIHEHLFLFFLLAAVTLFGGAAGLGPPSVPAAGLPGPPSITSQALPQVKLLYVRCAGPPKIHPTLEEEFTRLRVTSY